MSIYKEQPCGHVTGGLHCLGDKGEGCQLTDQCPLAPDVLIGEILHDAAEVFRVCAHCNQDYIQVGSVYRCGCG